MRIQNDITGERFNRFADIVDLDRLAMQEYTPEVLADMSQKILTAASGHTAAHSLSLEEAKELLARAVTGGRTVFLRGAASDYKGDCRTSGAGL